MGNVRITNLPANRRVAAHDCPTCTKRRIKCDRSEPFCLKCASRGLECPGFKTVYLKWNQGIASRGRLAGKSVPVAKGANTQLQKVSSTSSQRRPSQPESCETEDSRRPQAKADENKQEPTPTITADKKSSPQTVSRSVVAISHVETKHVVDPFMRSSVFESLINHFCTKAVTRLTWIDQPRHPLRTIVQRLLRNSACVRFSVGSLAAAHMSMVPNIPPDQSQALFQTYATLRDESMRTLSSKMRSGLPSRSSVVARDASTNFAITEILAAMLVLCYAEVLVPGSSDWKLHLRGCRTIIDLQPLESWFRESTDPIVKFLLKEIFDLEMLTGISTFHQALVPVSSAPHTDTGWAFTKLIHTMTELERKRHRLRLADVVPPSIDMDVWRGRAHEAHIQSMACTEWLNDSQSTLRDCFEAVARAHYFATIIYGYQAFKTFEEKSVVLPSLLEPLLADVRFVMAGPTDELFHDLFFPLFIAGIELVSDAEMRREIDNMFVESLSRTGVWCNYSALQFLRNFWGVASTAQEPVNWLDFARANLSAMETFIVF